MAATHVCEYNPTPLEIRKARLRDVLLAEDTNPRSHVQTGWSTVFVEFDGQVTRVQLEVKNGADVERPTDPLYPGEQEHPSATDTPLLLMGHLTATHELVYEPDIRVDRKNKPLTALSADEL